MIESPMGKTQQEADNSAKSAATGIASRTAKPASVAVS
jgi:hypothetical protein